jgi:hypothetical protein
LCGDPVFPAGESPAFWFFEDSRYTAVLFSKFHRCGFAVRQRKLVFESGNCFVFLDFVECDGFLVSCEGEKKVKRMQFAGDPEEFRQADVAGSFELLECSKGKSAL